MKVLFLHLQQTGRCNTWKAWWPVLYPPRVMMDSEGDRHVAQVYQDIFLFAQRNLYTVCQGLVHHHLPQDMATHCHSQTLSLQKYNNSLSAIQVLNYRHEIILYQRSMLGQIRNYSELENTILACQSHHSCSSHPYWQNQFREQ